MSLFLILGMLNQKEISPCDDSKALKSTDKLNQFELEVTDEEDQKAEVNDSKISDEEFVEEIPAVSEAPAVAQVSSLVADYGSDSGNVNTTYDTKFLYKFLNGV